MNGFSYTRPSDVSSAVAELTTNPSAKFIAGGTNLIDLMKENIERPTRLVDINRLPLNSITKLADGGLRLGALVTNADTAYHPLIEQRVANNSGGSLTPVAQHGHQRRQPVSAHPLLLFL